MNLERLDFCPEELFDRSIRPFFLDVPFDDCIGEIFYEVMLVVMLLDGDTDLLVVVVFAAFLRFLGLVFLRDLDLDLDPRLLPCLKCFFK